MTSRDSLVGVRERCADLGATCTEIQDRTPHEAVVDVTDPDGTLLRFHWADLAAVPDVFVGYEFDGEGPPRTVDEPRLDAPAGARPGMRKARRRGGDRRARCGG